MQLEKSTVYVTYFKMQEHVHVRIECLSSSS